MSLVLSWSLFLSVSLVIYCVGGFRWSGHQGQAGSVVWWIPCGHVLAAPVALAWALPTSSPHISAGSGLADHLCWAQSPATLTNSNESYLWPSSRVAIGAPVHVHELLRGYHGLPLAPWRSWELSEHMCPTHHDLLPSGWINKTVVLVSVSPSHPAGPLVLCSGMSLPWILICAPGDSSLGFHLPRSRNSEAVVIMCLMAVWVCLKFGKFNISKVLCGCMF